MEYRQGTVAAQQRKYPTFKVRSSSFEGIPQVQGQERQLCFAGAAVKRYPTSKVRETQVKMVGAKREHQRADRLKPQTQTTGQSDYTDHSLSNSMKPSHAIWGHPRQMGHGGEV